MDLLAKLRDDLVATYTALTGSAYKDAATSFANAILDAVGLSGVFFAVPETETITQECLDHLTKIETECKKAKAGSLGNGTFLNFIKDILPTLLAFINGLLKPKPPVTP